MTIILAQQARGEREHSRYISLYLQRISTDNTRINK